MPAKLAQPPKKAKVKNRAGKMSTSAKPNVAAKPTTRRTTGQAPGATQLPEGKYPFSRWVGTAVAALWAVGVQSVGDPWAKLAAIVTPGVGYGASIVMDRLHRWVNQRNNRLECENAQKNLADVKRARDQAKQDGSSAEMIAELDRIVVEAEMNVTSLLAVRVNGQP